MEYKVNIFGDLNKIGEQIIEQFEKRLKEDANVTKSNNQMEEVYEGYKTIGEILFYMKEGLVDAGFTEDQAMQFIIREYIEQRAGSKR
ncbi:hypothetical protein P4V88_27495 [Bacillus thuringiensis]|uniref:hypothetical protein n=1 Tax=Bacillus thuringiensis TaxID=1428 RepID=UPI000A3BA6EB|nr:hypothetical protein [Bacillus thuringiensis]MED2128933.1 hypothetical protein [Bacillus thuringiensis]MED2148653.1 hypothetical protein [Bacillus thuringiensis]MED2175639.1 hypothetical protein [Bacillus thuringiensis]MED2478082.1 hypothetical protein [Bacillus thuringiensis]MED2575272.1 hypothetical protein [Bacillus thuringiensis]